MVITAGTVVISVAGHDKGHWFVVTDADEKFAFLADGKERKLADPKKKNLKHIRKTDNTITISDLTDKRLRSALNALSRGITEESEELV